MAISAMLDGEDPGADPDQVRAHLDRCAGCRTWRVEAADATRLARLGPVEVPDLTATVLAAVADDRRASTGASSGARRRVGPRARAVERIRVLRWALALSAVAQLLLALPALVAVSGAIGHAGREMASFDVAIAVGFLLAAWRPHHVRGLVPVGVALAVCLLLTSTLDVANGAATLGHELNHLLAGVQAGLLWALSRAYRLAGPGTRIDSAASA